MSTVEPRLTDIPKQQTLTIKRTIPNRFSVDFNTLETPEYW